MHFEPAGQTLSQLSVLEDMTGYMRTLTEFRQDKDN